jgi:hypothetical protein
MALTKKQLENVCYISGGHLQCRYLDEDFNDKGEIVNVCKKHSPEKKIIDEEVNDFINYQKKIGKTVMDERFPVGDNCKGYIVLKSKLQGYDVD